MEFPRVNACIITELVRAEARSKLSALGLYGLTPNVGILLKNPPPQSVGPLTFLLFCNPGKGTYKCSGRIADHEENTVVQIPEFELTLAGRPESKSSNVAIGLSQVEFKKEGIYRFEFNIDGKLHYRTTFNVELGPTEAFEG